jgi:predicted anti-sigma-YlaC factor YlaD
MSCDFARDAGSYVLGALSPAERQAFEEHLGSCPECARSVQELAGLPGLLARVDPSVLESASPPDPVPDTLLPVLVQRARRTRRRRTLGTAAAAAAAAVTVTVVWLAGSGALSDDRTPQPPSSTRDSSLAVSTDTAMTPVGHAPVRADLALASVPWGTRLDLACTYTPEATEYGVPAGATYAMVVLARHGQVEQVGTWRSLPDRTMRLTAATAFSRTDIRFVEVRTADGKPVLRLAA